MSAKARFLQKLQDNNPRIDPNASKGQADLAAFQLRLEALQGIIDDWLEGTGIAIANGHCLLTEMLIGSSAFTVPCFELHHENRVVKFTPIYLYGQGVTGCVEVTLIADGKVSVLGRLFMRSAESQNWTYTSAHLAGQSRKTFDEEAFFTVIEPVLP
ncbi:hypothetical protein CIG19_13910 [Enterobacterales bacterium CwR94]|nr:hypothetical protein CIG19_13910 [Enterobacterales bacterium CwR94]